MQTLLFWLFSITSFYAFIPGMITRIFGYHVFRRGLSSTDYALTFDDGPDPHYTPQLLDLLKRYGAKATFFVVGSHAERYPDIIKRMHDEGHLIGIHNYVHISNWIMRPKTVRKQIERTSDIIHRITGERSVYYRPPWGIVNLFDFSKRRQTQIVLWSAMVGDWKEKLGADRLTQRLLRKLNPGEVLVLHDCGTTFGADPAAPGNMLIALERMLEEGSRRGLKSIRIDNLIKQTENSPVRRLSFGKRLIVGLWLLWEQLFHFMFKLKTISPDNPFMHYRLRKYQGHTLELENGDLLQSGDPVIELHFDNRKLFELGVHSRSSAQLAIRLVRKVEKEFPVLAETIASDPALASAKAVYGVSMINRGPEKFGFAVLDLKDGLFARSTKFYLSILLSVIHPSGGARLKERTEALVPKIIVMPVSEMLRRMNKQPQKQPSRPLEQPREEELSLEHELPGATVH